MKIRRVALSVVACLCGFVVGGGTTLAEGTTKPDQVDCAYGRCLFGPAAFLCPPAEELRRPPTDINEDQRKDWWIRSYKFKRERKEFMVQIWCLNDPLNAAARGRDPVHMFAMSILQDWEEQKLTIV